MDDVLVSGFLGFGMFVGGIFSVAVERMGEREKILESDDFGEGMGGKGVEESEDFDVGLEG